MDLIRFFGAATMFCVAVTLQLLGCALYDNWWPVRSCTIIERTHTHAHTNRHVIELSFAPLSIRHDTLHKNVVLHSMCHWLLLVLVL